MITATDISFKVANRYLLQPLSLDFAVGRLHLVIGPNGAGKSTLIKLLSGQQPSAGGTISYNNRPLNQYTIEQLAKVRAVLSQSMELSFPLSVWEVVMMGRYPHFTGRPEEKDIKAVTEAMQLFGISEMAQRDYTTLSGGEKQRVHFARVMAQIWYPSADNKRYLLLDEPLTFLDVHYQYQFMEQIKELLAAGDLVVIGVVHDLNLALKYADDITLLHNGAILATGKPEDVLSPANIKTAYGMEPVLVAQNGKNYLFF